MFGFKSSAALWYSLFGVGAILLYVFPDSALPFPEYRWATILGCILGMLFMLRIEGKSVDRVISLAREARKPPSDPTPEGKKEDPKEYTWAEYMADIEKGMLLNEVREKLGGRPFPRRPAPPSPPPDEEEDDEYEDVTPVTWEDRINALRFRGDRVSGTTTPCNLCGVNIPYIPNIPKEDDYCDSCRAIRLKASHLARSMERARFRLRRNP